jgi:hypothetical protein
MGEVIATHAVMFLEVADDRLDRGASFELVLDLGGDAALLTGRVAARPVCSYFRSRCGADQLRRSRRF